MNYLIRLDDNIVCKRHANQIRKIGNHVSTDNMIHAYIPVENTVTCTSVKMIAIVPVPVRLVIVVQY